MAQGIAWVTVVVVAALLQRLFVPRVTVADVDEDDFGDAPSPDFRSLGGAEHVAWTALLAAIAGAALLRLEQHELWQWAPYLAIGAPLVYVDLRTTYLPNQLMYPLWMAVAVGTVISATQDPPVALGAGLGAAAGFALLWCVWRFSRSFGFGDVRLGAAVGALGGASSAVFWGYAFVLGTLLGAVVAVVAAILGRRIIPYGPWLWLGPPLALAIGW